MKNKAIIYNEKWRGQDISKYGLEHGYIDYRCLANCCDALILNNDIIKFDIDFWEEYSGELYNYYNANGDIITCEEYDNISDGDTQHKDIYQYYIIPEYAAEFLKEYTDEIILYNERINMFLWCITHYGTSWNYVLTDIKIMEDNEND